ncbi:MAG: hypothetical protein GU343_02900 [Nanoarchaeota archaeon]|jgi:hypothetical protein|nr:hypothetical protein [Nanoarchaeota archaeon]
MVRRRRSPIIGEEIEKSKKIGKEVKTGDRLSINGETKEINLSCNLDSYSMYLTNKDKVKLNDILEVAQGDEIIVYIRKPQISRLDGVIAGLVVRRRGEFNYLSKITGRGIPHYTEKIEGQGNGISHYLEIGVGDNNNLDTLIGVGVGGLYINYSLLPPSEAKIIECVEEQIGSYIKREITSLFSSPYYPSGPTVSLSIELHAVSIGKSKNRARFCVVS